MGREERTANDTGSYIDDILVEELMAKAEEVVEHLGKFGLIAKASEHLEGGAELGLRLQKDHAGELVFRRRNEVLEIEMGKSMNRRESFSVCG